MPSFFGHAVAGIALGAAFTDEKTPRRAIALGTLCALAPDLDCFTLFLKLHPGNYLAHRGVTHSLLAAVMLAATVLLLGFKAEQRTSRMGVYLLLATLSHGLLDACTSGRIGVAFFYPFSSSRWGCYWQPFVDPPLPFWAGQRLPFLEAVAREALWIGVPGLLLVGGVRLVRHLLDWSSLSEVESEG